MRAGIVSEARLRLTTRRPLSRVLDMKTRGAIMGEVNLYFGHPFDRGDIGA
jgi:hypothetical protein